jgi:hypothetical protein
MKPNKLLILVIGFIILISFAACKPINIFSPFVDPSKMGNEAKMDAGYNAIANGDYQSAINYFTDVINSGTSGEDLIDAYIGRATAYVNEASPYIDDVAADVMNGDIDADDQGEIINQVVRDGDYENFYDNIENAADDYNSAIDNTTGEVDPGILFEAYQANMMAATGVGSQAIALLWDEGGTYPGVTNAELEAITDETSGYTYHIGTWSDSTPAVNGLRVHVEPDATAKASMMGYLTNAYDALEELKLDPPTGMEQSDIINMQTGIQEWSYFGLNDSSLGIP